MWLITLIARGDIPCQATMNLRMRQICLVARELAPIVDTFRQVFGLEVCHRDPGVGSTDSRTRSSPLTTAFSRWWRRSGRAPTAGRYLDRRGGDGGYMVITQCADLTPRRARCEAVNVRIANEIHHGGYEEIQLHPRDVGAAMLSFSRQVGPRNL
jgi:hypothetical protein